ncbi:MAG: SPASM domain-containing protein [Candidatus Omnitrophica bacterium]|nr:SPASM domain-containing protein [Candidatus Omnitrophota bacterium]
MISIDVDKKSSTLSIYFDIPVPPSFEQDPEFSSFMQKLKEYVKAELRRSKDGSLSAFSVGADQWIEYVKDISGEKEAAFHKEMLDAVLAQGSRRLGEGLDINFHQRSFDTPERYWGFVLSQGQFQRYFLNRFKWYLCPRYAIVSPFPVHVDLESASTCNMKCPMCYRDQLKETGQMDVDLFKKAIDECAANNLFSIRLSWRGETLTHPQIEEMIAYATSRIDNVSFLTNAFFIDDKKIDFFIKSRLSYVAVSFDGIDDTYEAVRHPARFKESYEHLAALRDRKKELKSMLPQVRVCTLWPAISKDPDAYYEKMKEVSDYVVCNPYINFKGQMKIKPDFICQYPWERIVVAFNGDAQCCTGWNADDIVLGNIKDKSIHELWHSSRLNKIRRAHSEGRRMELNSCARCRHGSKGDPNIDIQDILKRGY